MEADLENYLISERASRLNGEPIGVHAMMTNFNSTNMKEIIESFPLDHCDNGEIVIGEPSFFVMIEESHLSLPWLKLANLIRKLAHQMEA